MLSYFRQWAKSKHRFALKLFAERPVSRLCSNPDVDLRLIGDSLQEASRGDLSSEEGIWIDRIETLRKTLSISRTEIDVVDFGAGEPNLVVSNEKMQSGRFVTRTVGSICRTASMPPLGSMVLFKLIRKFKPTNCVELGTSLGISAAYEAAALAINHSGQLTTLEGSETLAILAVKNHNYLGLTNVKVVIGRFQDTLPSVLEANKPVDYVFIDGHHDENATVAYFETIKRYLAEKSLIIFDDISWSPGMKNAWKIIAADDQISISIDLKQIGVCIYNKRSSYKKTLKIPLI